jgi:hypothetical protein
VKKIFGVIWFFLVAVFLFAEGLAVGSAEQGDTFTEWTRQLLAYWPLEVGFLGFWGWLGWHFFLEQRLKRRAATRTLMGMPTKVSFTAADSQMLREMAGDMALEYAKCEDFRVRRLYQKKERALDDLAERIRLASQPDEQ